jgi:hypothetical protein
MGLTFVVQCGVGMLVHHQPRPAMDGVPSFSALSEHMLRKYTGRAKRFR